MGLIPPLSGGGGGGITADEVATLTNKTIASKDNPIIGVEVMLTALIAVDFTTLGNTTLLDCSSDIPVGYQFFPTGWYGVCTEYDNKFGNGSVTIGNNALSYDNLSNFFSPNFSDTDQHEKSAFFGSFNSGLTVGSNDMILRVGTADSGTAYAGVFALMGILTPT